MKKPFKLSTKLCTFLFLLICLIFCGIVAWEVGSDAAIETVWVAREKIVGAEPYLATKQVNVEKGLLYGVPVFVVGGLFSVTLAELYYAALRFFRGENNGDHTPSL